MRHQSGPAQAGERTRSGIPLHFLMFNVDAPDGVSRAVLTLANFLARTHPVEIISLYRRSRGPAYPISGRITVTYLFDHPPLRRGDDAPRSHRTVPRRRWWPLPRDTARVLLGGRRSRFTGGRGFPNYSLLSDLLLLRKLRTIRTGVLISTRPALHAAAARVARPGVLTIGQDHLNFESRSRERGSLDLIEGAARRGLDSFVTLTPTDAVDYAHLLAATSTRVRTIPNALSWPVSPPQAHDRRVVVAAGRLVRRKGMGRLVRAFAPVAARHPDWQLQIYGTGRLRQRLREQVDQLDLGEQVHLMGHTEDLPTAFAEAAVFASASRAEGFPMVMLEAMSVGLPLVSFDCPRGPGDIIHDGRNGLLVPDNDLPALTAALESLVGDDDRRRSMGAQALVDAGEYVVDRIAASWELLIVELSASTQRLDGA